MNAKLIRSLALWVFLICWIGTIAALWLNHQHLLALCIGIPLPLVGVGEIVSKMQTGQTMSQRFWRTLTATRFWIALSIGVVCLVGLFALWVHLLWR